MKMQRWIGVFVAVLAVGVLVGIGLQQASVERRVGGRETCIPGAGPAGALGLRWFWTGRAPSGSLGSWQEISALESVVETIPDYAPGYRALSLACALAGSSEQAVGAAVRYAALRPDDPDARLLLASVYSLSGSYDEALAELREVQGDDSVTCWAEKMRGDVFAAKGMFVRALECYGLFVERVPYEILRSDGHFYAGVVLIEQKRFPEAVGAFEESGYPDSSDPRAHWGKALAYAGEGGADRAREEAALIKTRAEQDGVLARGQLGLLMGRILMAEERWGEAVGVLEGAAAEAQGPVRLRCLTALAEASWRAGRPREARDALDRCLAINPNEAHARYLSGRLLEEEGLLEASAAEFQAFLDIWQDADPGVARVADATERLREARRLLARNP